MSTLKKKERRQPQRISTITTHGLPLDQDFVSRRIKRHLNDLERTNYTEPSVGASSLALREREEEEADESAKTIREQGIGSSTGRGGMGGAASAGHAGKKKRSLNVRTLLTYRKNLNTLIEESGLTKLPSSSLTANYLSISARPSHRPALHLCSVCGYKGKYGCMRCGTKYCDLGCKAIHDESRCEKR